MEFTGSHEEFCRRQFETQLREDFFQGCPDEYLRTDLAHPDMPPQHLWKKVLNWNHETSKGLLIQGETGKGKTRIAWLLVRRLMLDLKVRVRFITDPSFSREYSRRLGKGTADEWIDKLVRAPVLFIDDLGKSAVTPRYKEQFHDVLESRTSRNKPMIITTQLNRSALLERFGTDDGTAIVRRLLEFTDIVNF